jgi:hypothetical protein
MGEKNEESLREEKKVKTTLVLEGETCLKP